MTNPQEIENNTYAILARIFRKDECDIHRDTQLIKDLLAKSMNFLEMQAMLEAEFNIELSNMDIMKAKTAGDLVDLVGSKTR
jgi:acyl carrier protein